MATKVEAVKNAALPSHSQVAHQYARDVADGTITACKWVRLAGQRHCDDLTRSESEDYPYRFDEAKGNRICKFLEMMPHTAGKWRAQGLKLTLEPWQKFMLASIFGWVRKRDGNRRFATVYVCVPRKNGKALALDTRIPTPTGWTTMGQLNVGDKVFGADGSIRTVVAATDTMYDRPCYEVGFSNGETIVADANHLWKTDSRRHRDNVKPHRPMPSIKTTEEIANSLLCRAENNHRVDITGPLQLPEVDLPISPYVLGAWLGDGTSASAQITIGDADKEAMFANLRTEGQDFRKISGKYRYALNNGDRTKGARSTGLGMALRSLGVLNNKHIPQMYLRASYEQRLALLQGLMDTDGTCSKAGQCTITTISPALRDGYSELVSSLGLKPSVRAKEVFIGEKSCGIAYDVQFFAYADTNVFRFDRKTVRQKAVPGISTRARTIQVVFCRSVSSVPVRCIQVDHEDGMFIVGNFVPTHNSQILAGVGLYMLCLDGEYGAQVYSGATSEKQASFVFDPAKIMATDSPEFLSRYGVEVNASSIVVPKTNSKFERLIGHPKDGGGASFFVLDEWHQAPDAILHDTMVTGMAAREQPLAFIITTAGSDTNGPCFPFQQDVQKTLEGSLDNPDLFGLIYTIDEGIDWTTEDALKMANPNWGISVNSEIILARQKVAIQSPEKQNDFKTKHLDIWCSSASTWLNVERWNALADAPPLSLNEDGQLCAVEFLGQPSVIGLDLASQVDMAASVKLFQKEIDGVIHYYVYPTFYLPEERAQLAKFQHYQRWVVTGDVVATPGSETDYAYIKRDLYIDIALYDVKELAFDKYQAVDLKQQVALETGINTTEVPQTVTVLSEPAKWLEAMITSGRIHHTGNPIMSWNIGNAVITEDVNQGILPKKDKKRPDNKIDGVSALLNALVRVKAALGDGVNGGYAEYDGL